MRLQILDDVKEVDALSELLATLPLEVESWDGVHELLRR